MKTPIKYIRKELRYDNYLQLTDNINKDLTKIIEDGFVIHTYNEKEYELDNKSYYKVIMLLVKYNFDNQKRFL